MTKREFTEALKSKLTGLPEHEIEKTISFYVEMIDDRIEDGLSEEEAVADLGDIDKIAQEILIDLPLTSLIQNKIKDSHKKSKNRILWMVLAICGFPLWLPLAITFAALFFTVYVCIWAGIISLFAVEIALAGAGVAGIIAGIITCFTNNVPSGIAIIGMSIFALGLFILSIKPFIWLCKKLFSLTGVFLRKIKSLFMNKKEG